MTRPWLIYFTRFGIVGIITTSLHMVFATLLVVGFDISSLWANTFTFCILLFFSYVANTHWSFNKKITTQNLKRYICLALINLMVVMSVSATTGDTKLSAVIGIIFIALCLPVTSFFIQFYWVYKDNPDYD